MEYVAFLRALNVGGRLAPMSEVAAGFDTSGVKNIRTFLASGNVMFTSDSVDTGSLEDTISEALADRLKFDVPVMVRSAAAIVNALDCWPFQTEDDETKPTRCIGFAKLPLSNDCNQLLASLGAPEDSLLGIGQEIYWTSTLMQSSASFTLVKLERTIGNTVTFRTRKTVERLNKMLEDRTRTST